MVEERLVELRWGRGAWKLGALGGRAANGEFLSRPQRLGGSRGQEGGPVVPFRLLDGLEISGSRRPCGREEGRVEAIPFRRGKSRVVGLSEHRQEL